MKAWVISDMHVTHAEFKSAPFDIPQADVCICAGDVSDFIELSLDFLNEKIAPLMPVVLVLGNHDFFGTSISNALALARSRTSGTPIRLLENEVSVIGNIRIIGATLWTDFEMPFDTHGHDLSVEERRSVAVTLNKQYMLDFREIYRSEPLPDGMPGMLTARELIIRHSESRSFIEMELSKAWTGKTVVLTHHAPSPRSLLKRFEGHPSNAAFASDLTDVIGEGRPDIWVHGHIHQYLDYVEQGTRVICNPRGYRNERTNNGYQPGFVIDI